MTETQSLLAEYAGNGSETAFRELVARYIDFVYSAASRMVQSAPHLAEDVTQIVFADLARKAGSLSREVMLGRWLHRHTCYVAANLMRGERRRHTRERKAAEMDVMPDHSSENLAQITPILDDAINHLGTEERTAILLRFFEQRDLRSVGLALGGSEEAARKRVSRALDKLQVLLKRRGVALSTAALATVLATGTVKAAPAGLAVSVGTSALAGAAPGALTLLKLMAMTKLKAGIAGAIIAAGIATTIVVQQNAQAKIRQDEAALQQQSAQLAQLRADNTPPSTASAPGGNPNTPEELARLRDEVAALRLQTNDLATLREANRQRLAARPPAGGSSPLRTQAERMARMNFAKQAMLAFILFSQKHDDYFPTNIVDAADFLPENLRAKTDDFEVLYQGKLRDVSKPAETIVLRGTDSWQNNGKWARIYAFADGHVEVANTPDNDFSAWESRHIIVNPVK
jgi:RNA polymerase sigma factor (sigma-70 family)